MRKAFGNIGRSLADPRVRAIAALILLLVVLALAWHAIGMADLSVGMIGGACLTVLTAGLILSVTAASTIGSPALPMVPLGPLVASASAPRAIGRDPPRDGDVLRM